MEILLSIMEVLNVFTLPAAVIVVGSTFFIFKAVALVCGTIMTLWISGL